MTEVRVFNLERFALDDGPGIRTVVFMQGCPLHCPWCSNPESQPVDGGSFRTISDILDEVERDKDYYDASGGGVTFSGGEPLLHAGAFLELVEEARRRGIHTAVETSLMADTQVVRSLLPVMDLWLVDLKHTSPGLLKDETGATWDLYLRNLALPAPEKVILRRPCIPGFNLEPQHMEDAFRFALEKGIRRMDLIPFHTLGAEKYRRLGLEYPYGHIPALDKKELEPYKRRGLALGIDTRIL